MKKILTGILFTVGCFALGYLLGHFLASDLKTDIPWLLFAFFGVLALFLQIVIHEAGHLVFGLLTGYGFLSFRIFGLVLQKTGGSFSLRRYKLAGTAGQCLLVPPDNSEDYPYFLYNIGGVLFNLISALLFLPLYYLCRGRTAAVLFLLLCAFGLLGAAVNGIPVETQFVANDGANIRMLRRNAAARKAMWLQLEINRRQTEGERLRDMPETLFALPEGANLHVPLISSILALDESRYMDRHEFDKARERIDLLLSDECSIIGLYAPLLTADRVYIELLQRGSEADISALHEKSTAAMLRKMKEQPMIIRTQYAEALLKERDRKKADKYKRFFEKTAKSYPIAADLSCEAELMALADEAFAAQDP